MSEEKSIVKFQELLNRVDPTIQKGLIDLKEKAVKNYKNSGHLDPLKGFFSIFLDKMVLFQATNDSIPESVQNNKDLMDIILKTFKDFLIAKGHDIHGFLFIGEGYIKEVKNNKDVNETQSISEDIKSKECMIFTIDTKDFAYMSAFEKISVDEDFVISPEPIYEEFINKNNKGEVDLVMNHLNFFSND